MATIHELPRKEASGIPPELANLTREGLQEYMLGVMRESVFATFDTSPEIAKVTLRREIAGRFWDITIGRRAYATTDDPTEFKPLRHDELVGDRTITLLYAWEAIPTGSESDYDGDHEPRSKMEVFGTPEEAYTDARATLAEGEREGPF